MIKAKWVLVIRMSFVALVCANSMQALSAEGESDAKLISIRGLAKFGIARLISINGKETTNQKDSSLIRLGAQQGSQPFEFLELNFVRNDSKGVLANQKGVISIEGTGISITPPGPRVDRVKFAEFLPAGREISFERVVETELFQESDIPALVESMKKMKFVGTDTDAMTLLKARRVQRHSQREVWLVNDLEIDPEVSVHALANAQSRSDLTLDFKTWGQGSLTLNIQKACEKILRNAAAQHPESASLPNAAEVALANESILRRAISELK